MDTGAQLEAMRTTTVQWLDMAPFATIVLFEVPCHYHVRQRGVFVDMHSFPQLTHSSLAFCPGVFTNSSGGHSYSGGQLSTHQLGIEDMTSPMTSPSRNGQYAGVCLFCFHLPYELDERGLQGMFEPYGTVVHVKVMRDLQTGRSKVYANSFDSQ